MRLNHIKIIYPDYYLLYRLDKIKPIVYNNLLKNMGRPETNLQHIAGPEIEGIVKPSTLPRYPLLAKIGSSYGTVINYLGRQHDRFLNADIFDGNAYKGHLLYGAAGVAVATGLTYLSGSRADLSVIGTYMGLVAIPSLLLAWHSYDKDAEKNQAHAITFFPFLTWGIGGGSFLGNSLLEKYALPIGEELEKVLPYEAITPASAVGITLALSVYLAYFTTGAMSRYLRLQLLPKSLPESVDRVINTLAQQREQTLADQLVKAVGKANIVLAVEILESYRANPDIVYEEEEMTLEQIRELIVLRKEMKKEEKEKFDAIREGRLPSTLIDLAIQDVVDWHFNKRKNETDENEMSQSRRSLRVKASRAIFNHFRRM